MKLAMTNINNPQPYSNPPVTVDICTNRLARAGKRVRQPLFIYIPLSFPISLSRVLPVIVYTFAISLFPPVFVDI